MTGDTARRLGRFFGTSGEFWLNLQKLYELRCAAQKRGPGELLHRSSPRARDVLLVVEVADSSLRYDRAEKVPGYGRAAIPETWLVEVEHARSWRTPIRARRDTRNSKSGTKASA